MEVITTHQNADFDAMASMIAAKKIYPDAVLAFSGSQEKNIRDFLVQSTHVYDFQRTRNIRLDQVARLIIVDTRQPGRIGTFAKCLKNPGLKLHLYDHHPDAPGDLKGDFEIVRPVGATITLFVEIFQKKSIRINAEEATLMALGLYADTGSFTYDTTTPDDLSAMSWLLAKGANLNTVSQYISHELTTPEVALLHDLINSATTYTIEGIDIVVAKLSVPEYVDEFALLVRRFMVMENLDTLFAVAAMGETVYFIARSRIPEVNAGKIAADLGGGGHASAASASIRDMTIIETEEKLIRLLHKHVRPRSLARELMSSPVISVKPDISINEANRVLTRYNITVVPILKKNQELMGHISRRVAEKSIFHGLGDLPVTEYMSTEFATVPPTATLADIQELIIENRQRFIPVVDNQKVVGVITRTDLLNLLVNEPANLPKDLLHSHTRPSIERNRNLNNLLIESCERKMIVLLQTIGQVAAENNYTAYAVGGFVRDLLLHTQNFDIDIVIEGDGIDFSWKLAKRLDGAVRTHEKFKTAVVKLCDGFKIDVATARLEYYEYPAAMPIVEFSSLKLDLYRRDFTINAMAIHLNPDKFGALVDFFNCQNDIKDRQIRVLHNLSFVEDPTRILRAIRFAQRMDFSLGKHTEKLIKNAVKSNLFKRISSPGGRESHLGRRLFNELKLILSEENPLPAIKRMARFKLLKVLHPSLKIDKRLIHILKEVRLAVGWHRLLYLDESCRHWLVYMLALFAGVSGKDLNSFCKRFEVPERYTQLMVKIKTEEYKIIKTLNRRSLLHPSETFWLLNGLSHEVLLYLMSRTRRNAGKKAISLYVTHLRHVKTHIQGSDLKEMGYRSGPVFKTILNHLLEARLDGHVSSREDEVDYVRSHYLLKKLGDPK
ncbi:MAG: CBS domain-containing protein [Desulfobulbaceae bacterium]|nr:CBS domain-containing protein [Desulfobulbaceae bacterium]